MPAWDPVHNWEVGLHGNWVWVVPTCLVSLNVPTLPSPAAAQWICCYCHQCAISHGNAVRSAGTACALQVGCLLCKSMMGFGLHKGTRLHGCFFACRCTLSRSCIGLCRDGAATFVVYCLSCSILLPAEQHWTSDLRHLLQPEGRKRKIRFLFSFCR